MLTPSTGLCHCFKCVLLPEPPLWHTASHASPEDSGQGTLFLFRRQSDFLFRSIPVSTFGSQSIKDSVLGRVSFFSSRCQVVVSPRSQHALSAALEDAERVPLSGLNHIRKTSTRTQDISEKEVFLLSGDYNCVSWSIVLRKTYPESDSFTKRPMERGVAETRTLDHRLQWSRDPEKSGQNSFQLIQIKSFSYSRQ